MCLPANVKLQTDHKHLRHHYHYIHLNSHSPSEPELSSSSWIPSST